MPTGIVIGATSGIGWSLAHVLSQRGYDLGVTGRRTDRLESLRDALPTTIQIQPMDLKEPEKAQEALKELIDSLGGEVDLIVLNAGVGHPNKELKWRRDKETIDINITGFTALAHVAFHQFLSQGKGHLVGVSSLAGLRGNSGTGSYNASKAYVIRYLETLRCEARKRNLPIHVTDIRPGFVDTPMTQGQKGMFWVASADEAARQIADAIQSKKKAVCITRRWTLISWLIPLVPDRFWCS